MQQIQNKLGTNTNSNSELCGGIIGWPNSLFRFFHKIRHIFIFTNICIDLDILSVLAISHVAEHWLFSIHVWNWSLSISTGLPDCGASFSEKSLAWNFSNHFWHVQSVTACSPHTAQIAFCVQLCFFLSWNNKAWYAENFVYFLPSSMLKWLHKNSPILVSFFKCTLIWQLSQCSLTKSFWMKLKTTKHY